MSREPSTRVVGPKEVQDDAAVLDRDQQLDSKLRPRAFSSAQNDSSYAISRRTQGPVKLIAAIDDDPRKLLEPGRIDILWLRGLCELKSSDGIKARPASARGRSLRARRGGRRGGFEPARFLPANWPTNEGPPVCNGENVRFHIHFSGEGKDLLALIRRNQKSRLIFTECQGGRVVLNISALVIPEPLASAISSVTSAPPSETS